MSQMMINENRIDDTNLELPISSISQQPMSLLTVERSSLTSDKMLDNQRATQQRDLLTLRILEASERKMQLIKQLLSPEEFDSLQTELISKNILPTNEFANAGTQQQQQQQQHQTKSIPLTNIELNQLKWTQQLELNNNVRRSNRLSRSEANLTETTDHAGDKFVRVQNNDKTIETSDVNVEQKIKENLRKNKEAIDFFFFQSADQPATGKELAIELRNGHYLSELTTETESELKSKLIKKNGFQYNWNNRLVSILSLFGLDSLVDSKTFPDCGGSGGNSLDLESPAIEEEEGEEFKRFVTSYEAMYSNRSPFNKRQNLITTYKRLKSANQLDKIDAPILRHPEKDSKNRSSLSTKRLQEFHKCHHQESITPEIKQAWNEFKLRNDRVHSNLLDRTCSIAATHLSGSSDDDNNMEQNPSHTTLLKYHPLVEQLETFLSYLPRRKRKLKQFQENFPEQDKFVPNRRDNNSSIASLSIRLNRLQFIACEYISAEDRQCSKFLEIYERSESLRENLLRVKSSIIECLPVAANNNESRVSDLMKRKRCELLINSIHWWNEKLKKLHQMQREMSSVLEKLESIRRKQPVSTSQCLQIKILNTSEQQSDVELNIQQQSEFDREYLPALGLDSDELVRLFKWKPLKFFQVDQMINAANATIMDEKVKKRRDNLFNWIDSLQIEIIVDSRYYQVYKLRDIIDVISQRTQKRDHNCFDIQTKEMRIRLHSPAKKISGINPQLSIPIECELYQIMDKKTLMGMSRRKLIAKGSKQIMNSGRLSMNNYSKRKIRMFAKTMMIQDDEDGEEDDDDKQEEDKEVCCLELSCLFENNLSKEEQTIEFLYEKLFKDSNSIQRPLQMKCSQLLNKIDPNVILIALLPQSQTNIMKQTKFMLDPFVDSFKLRDPIEDNSKLRRLLLVWRWLNYLTNQRDPQMQVYLSDLDNENAIKVNQIETKTTKLSKQIENINDSIHQNPSSSSSSSNLNGLKLIERIRFDAGEYLRNYELLVREKLRHYHSAELRMQLEAGNQNRRPPIERPILLEPKIEFISHLGNLPRLMSITLNMRKLLPRPRTARRPLMPQRKQASKRLAEMVSQELLLSPLQLSSCSQKQLHSNDLESQTVSHWHKFANSQRQQIDDGRGMQLLVTIQQANNLPMRIIYQPQHQNQMTRSSSPLFVGLSQQQQQQQQQQQTQGSPISFNLPNQMSQRTMSPIQLVSPTSYVEVVFQQKQQATSLALGKNPSWNETLFFQIEQSSTPMNSGNQGGGQLVDEYLELNVYDYFLSLFDVVESETGYDMNQMVNDGPTLQIQDYTISGNLSSQQQQQQQRSIIGQQSRLERHLLGSLRLPLSTLLNNGRIEGSFCLNQPLFLDNHQYEPTYGDFVADNGELQLTRTDFTYINLFITLNPPIALYNLIPMHHTCHHLEGLGSYETNLLFEYARLWEQFLSSIWTISNNQQQNMISGVRRGAGGGASRRQAKRLMKNSHLFGTRGRHVRALVLQKEAKYCLITRLLGPIKPPNELLLKEIELANNEMTVEQRRKRLREPEEMISALCRFVSLIRPLKHEFLTLKSLKASIWFDCKQLISQWLGGEQEEKSMLLCNYLLYLGHCCGLLLGDSIQDGRCVYVIMWREQTRFLLRNEDIPEQLNEQQQQQQQLEVNPIGRENFLSRLPIILNTSRSVQLIDANLGRIYSLSDRTLSLTSVGSIVTPENVYANIQFNKEDSSTSSIWPAQDISFDIRVRTNWLPLFDFNGGNQQTTVSQQINRSLRLQNKHRRRMMMMMMKNSSGSTRLIGQKLDLLQKSIIASGIIQPDLQPLISNPLALESDYLLKFSPEECVKFEQQLERTIKSNLLKWRPNRPTYFNRTLSRLLAEKLASFEEDLLSGEANNETTLQQQQQLRQDWRSKLADLIRNEILLVQSMSSSSSGGGAGSNQNKQVFSWPVNMPFSSMKSILNSLFASGVHAADMMTMLDFHQPTTTTDTSALTSLNTNNNQMMPLNASQTQFLVACHVRSYPARVLSVWLYVGAIVTNKRRGRLLQI